MSEMIMCHVECDGENCNRVFGNEPTMERIRQRAARVGWIYVKKTGLDYCPSCKKKLLLTEVPTTSVSDGKPETSNDTLRP